ncbi:WSC domain protein [Colletotrichum tofieldiae]|nr:WSC domain protein [Colletotrichum tofieldiae]GKT80642.1 WSC domain protein [Colletotrichum tofieldiae]GKT88768.1 WSC domain protein [Colletotrichum tofieldiae]
MSVLVIILLLATMIAAQANHVIHGFEYVGCVSAASDKFNAFVSFGRAYTPEECQSACTGRNYAAAFPDPLSSGCRCGSSLESFPKVDESLCSNPCNANAKFGFCGYSNLEGCSYANVYKACDENTPASSFIPIPGGSVSTVPTPSITFSTIRLPTVTRTLKLATKSTIVIHTVTPGNGGPAISCTLNDGSPPATLTAGFSSSPVVIVETVVVHVPPKSIMIPGLQSYGSIQLDPPVATVPPAETPATASQPAPSSLTLTNLIPYDPIPMISVPGNATVQVVTSTPEGPMFQTLILPGDPPATTATFTPAVVTNSPALRAQACAAGAAGVAGVVAAVLVVAGI